MPEDIQKPQLQTSAKTCSRTFSTMLPYVFQIIFCIFEDCSAHPQEDHFDVFLGYFVLDLECSMTLPLSCFPPLVTTTPCRYPTFLCGNESFDRSMLLRIASPALQAVLSRQRDMSLLLGVNQIARDNCYPTQHGGAESRAAMQNKSKRLLVAWLVRDGRTGIKDRERERSLGRSHDTSQQDTTEYLNQRGTSIAVFRE